MDKAAKQGGWGMVIVAWAAVLLPLAWGVAATVRKAMMLFAP